MAKNLEGKRIAFLATDGVEQSELEQPWHELMKAGAKVELLSVHKGAIQAMRHMDKGDTFEVDKLVAEADASDYDGLVLPGGVANPDTLRANRPAVAFVREFFEQVEARRGDLPWAMDAGRGGRRARPHGDVVAELEDRHQERGRPMGRRGSARR